jgi:hypothetical protein
MKTLQKSLNVAMLVLGCTVYHSHMKYIDSNEHIGRAHTWIPYCHRRGMPIRGVQRLDNESD